MKERPGAGAVERFLTVVANCVARLARWSPLDTRAKLVIDDSGDPSLVGTTATGTIRAWGGDLQECPAYLLLELDNDIDYRGHFQRTNIHWLVAQPCLQWRRASRLVLGSWSAVRVIEAPSFRDATYGQTIATGRLYML